MNYCTKCLYPSPKPDLWFDEVGVCSACLAFEARKDIDWVARENDFRQTLDTYRGHGDYDCLVPVSGGKDSTYQVIKLLEYGMTPLCVNATTDSLTPVGRRNLDNIKSLGVDLVEVTPNPVIRRKINKFTLEQVGDISWSEHVLIFTIPIRTALLYGIDLIVWGENSQNEYGGPEDAQKDNLLTRKWLEEFGGLLGLRVSDLPFPKDALIQYQYPILTSPVTGLFMGHYLPWDGYQNFLTAQQHGFEAWPTPVEGSLARFENLDSFQTGIHDYFKFIKYGFGRATDIACNHIRRGRMTREEGLKWGKARDGKLPWTYLGRPLEEILAEIDMTVDEFLVVRDKFANKKLFKFDSHGLIKDEDNDLTLSNPPC